MKVDVTLFFLQYPGFGPIKDPPKHTATDVGHLRQLPGDVILVNK